LTDRYHGKNSVSIDDLELRTSRTRNRSAELLSAATFGVAAVLLLAGSYEPVGPVIFKDFLDDPRDC
jgi:hypothetical protein